MQPRQAGSDGRTGRRPKPGSVLLDPSSPWECDPDGARTLRKDSSGARVYQKSLGVGGPLVDGQHEAGATICAYVGARVPLCASVFDRP